MQKIFKGFFVGVIGILASVVFFGTTHTAYAGVQDNVSGWLWSETIGWISLNCTNTNTCSTVDYGVKTDASGYFSGYAWSSNVGWISFNASDISGCPGGSCTQARLMTTWDGSVSGWARIVSGMQCPSAACPDDGFDGYIRMSGPLHLSPSLSSNGGVTIVRDENKLVGWAWSSDVGWIDFDSPQAGARITGYTSGTLIDLRAGDTPAVIWGLRHGSARNSSFDTRAGQPVTLSWKVENATSCTAVSTPADPSWNGPVTFDGIIPTNRQVSPSVTTQYKLDCTNGGAGVSSATVTVNVVSNPALNFNGATESQQTVTTVSGGANVPMHFSWTTDAQFTTCTATTTKYDNPTNTIIVSPIPVNPSWQGTNTLTNGLSLRGFGSMDVTISDYGNFRYEFKLQCSTATGYTATRTFIVNHQMSGGGVTWGAFTATPTTVQAGGDVYVRVYALAGSCTPTQDVSSASGGPTGWLSYRPTITPGWAINDYVHLVMGNTTTTITLTCIGPNGTTSSRSITLIVVGPPAATVSLTAFPATGLSVGGTTTLTYSSSNVLSCTTTPNATPAGNGASGWDGTSLLTNQTSSVNVTMGTTDTTFYIDCLSLDGVTHVRAQALVTLQKHLTLSFSNTVLLPAKTLPNATTPFQIYWWSDGALSGCVPTSTPISWWTTYPVTTAGTTHSASTANTIPTQTTFTLTCYDAGGAAVISNPIIVRIDGPVASVQPVIALTGPACINPDGTGPGDAVLSLSITDPSRIVNECTFTFGGSTYTWQHSDILAILAGSSVPFSIPVANPPTGTATFGPVNCTSLDPLITIPPTNQITVGYNGTAPWCNPTTTGGTKGGIRYQER